MYRTHTRLHHDEPGRIIPHAHQCRDLGNMRLQINNYPACIITKLNFRSALVPTSILSVGIKSILILAHIYMT